MNPFNHTSFQVMPITGIIRNHTIEELKAILPIYLEAGLTTLEITMNTPKAAEMIHYAASHYAGRLNIGAGTVCDRAGLTTALEAGASFIVMPIVDEEVITACVNTGVPVFPGAMTPTEIAKAWRLQATMVKVFPAATLGAAYFKDIQAPLNQVKMMATGGIGLENIDEFRKAGVRAFGIGSPLFVKTLIAAQDWKGLHVHFAKFTQKINACQTQNL